MFRRGGPYRLRAGFTIIELLVTIGIIGLLLSLVVSSLAGARRAALRTEESAAARQLAQAWQMYTVDSKDRVLPGYKIGLTARDAQGRPVEGLAAARYPWRLAPYFAYDFRGMYSGPHRAELDAMEQNDTDDPLERYQYLVSTAPSLGLNSIWVGGDQNFLGFNPAFTRVYGPFYVRTVTEINRPDRLLLFASARGRDPFDAEAPVTEGYFRVESRVLREDEGDLWDPEYRDSSDPDRYGQLSFRHGGKAVQAFVDGHVETAGPDELRDMRYWANRATGPDSGLVPSGAP